MALVVRLALMAVAKRSDAFVDIMESQDQMQAEMQAAMDSLSNETGFTFSVGYMDVEGRSFGFGAGPRTPKIFPPAENPSGNATGLDRFLIGSGTKMYTAAAVMRLVERGHVKLSDPASTHIDPSLTRVIGKNFVELFGAKAAQVQVKHLLQMQSGIGDFDIPSVDHEILVNYTDKVITPFDVITVVAGFNDTTRFVCDPGNCTYYSSTNYILAGLILTTHFNTTWDHYRPEIGLGLDLGKDYPNTFFANTGALNSKGNLSVVGISKAYGTAELYRQDSSILGWTCGNTVTSAHDVARFLYNLLGPNSTIVSKASLEIMTVFRPLTTGWAKDDVAYGTGLMIQDVSPRAGRLPPSTGLSAYIGHGGDTYAFMSDNGWFPQLNASISVIVNQDYDYVFPAYSATCKIVEIAAKYTGPKTPVDLECYDPRMHSGYTCHTIFGKGYCHSSSHGTESRSKCEETCGK